MVYSRQVLWRHSVFLEEFLQVLLYKFVRFSKDLLINIEINDKHCVSHEDLTKCVFNFVLLNIFDFFFYIYLIDVYTVIKINCSTIFSKNKVSKVRRFVLYNILKFVWFYFISYNSVKKNHVFCAIWKKIESWKCFWSGYFYI